MWFYVKEEYLSVKREKMADKDTAVTPNKLTVEEAIGTLLSLQYISDSFLIFSLI